MTRSTFASALPALVVLLASCSGREGDGRPGGESAPRGAHAAPVVPSIESAAAATYRGLDVAPEVTLAAGRWQGPPLVPGASSAPTATLARDFLVTGDLDGASPDEAVVLLGTNSGGTGSMNYVAVLSGATGRVVNAGTALLGDRVAVMRARIADRKIELDLVQAGPGDAMCCPSERATRVFALAAGSLAEVATTVTGSLSLADLGGVEWVLRGFDQDVPAPATPRVTLVFDGEQIAGSAGCNRYGGRVTAGSAPGDLAVDERLIATKMACAPGVMQIEDRYLAALRSVEKYQFLATRLALLYNENGIYRLLLFAAAPTAPDAAR